MDGNVFMASQVPIYESHFIMLNQGISYFLGMYTRE